MKKAWFLLPGAITLMLAAAPMVPSFTRSALADSAQTGRGMKFGNLNLTDAQKAQMKQIREAARQQMDAVFTAEQKQQLTLARQQRQRPNLNLTDDQKAQLKAIRENTKRQMDAVLTTEQKQQLQQWRQQHQRQHQQRQSQ